MINFVTLAKRFIHRLIAYLVGFILRPGATFDPHNFRIWERRGYHITPVHYHYPIPDTRELKKAYPLSTKAAGINMRPEFQLNLLREEFPKFSSGYNEFPIQALNSNSFYLNNDAFNGIDPHVYYSIIQHFQPKKIIEVGSGFSTILAFQALKRNNINSKLILIDSWPREFTRNFISRNSSHIEHLQRKVEELDIDLFLQLHENDILFIDSSHVVCAGSDVSFLLLEVIPRLSHGVIIHFHDIFLPLNYPINWVIEENRFWTEQYLLQAYLADNKQTEILFANNFISREYPEVVKTVFPKALQWDGVSFWIRRK